MVVLTSGNERTTNIVDAEKVSKKSRTEIPPGIQITSCVQKTPILKLLFFGLGVGLRLRFVIVLLTGIAFRRIT